nr:carbohydrate ABC transporter permease [uncultured Gemmiger sp.]
MAESTKRTVSNVVVTLVGIIIAFVMIFPIIWLLFSSFKPSTELFAYPLHLFPQEPTAEAYFGVIEDGIFTYFKNSLFLAVMGTIITVITSAMCGYALAIYRKELSYTNKVFAIFLLGTLIPGEILTITQFTVVCEMGLYNNIWGCILPVVTTTTGIFMYRQHYMSIPLELAESARIDGANEALIFGKIMLPLGSAVTITLTIFSFMWRWNDYILPLMLLSDQKNFTIQIAVKSYIGTMGVDWNSILSASVLSIVPVIIIFIFLQKYITGGIAATGVKG